MGLPNDKENFHPNIRLLENTTPNANEESTLEMLRSEGTLDDSDPQVKGNSGCFREDENNRYTDEQVLENCSFLSDSKSQTTNMEMLVVWLEVHHVEKLKNYELFDGEEYTTSYFGACKLNKYSGDRCCIRGCSVTKYDCEAKLHHFPKTKILLYKWVYNTQVKYDDKFPWRYRICDNHFEKQCFNGSRLLRGIVPTLRLDSNGSSKIYQNDFSCQEEAPTTNYSGASQLNQFSSQQCCIGGCGATTRDGKLHRFPKAKELLCKWMHNTQVTVNSKFHWRYCICDSHFERECFNGYRLQRGKVPTLRLGPNRPLDIYQNDQAEPAQNIKSKSLGELEPLCGKMTRKEPLRVLEPDHGNRIRKDTSPEPMHQCDSIELHYDAENPMNMRDNLLEWDEDVKEELLQLLVPELQLEVQDNEICFATDTARIQNGQHKLQKHVVYNEVKFGYGKCSLIHCQKQMIQHGVLLFKFSKSKLMQERWMHNLRIQYDEQRPYLICSEHFESRCMEKQKLKEWAVPTLQLGENVPEILFQNKVKKRSIKTCCLQYCRKQRDKNTKLFRLPNNPGMVEKWGRATGMTFTISQRHSKLICSRHFDPKLIGVRRLSKNAVPTLNLGFMQDAPAPVAVQVQVEAKIHKNRVPRYHHENPTSPPKCFISNCMSRCNVHLYKFPDNYILLRQWCRSLKLNDVVSFRGKYICANHLPVKPESCAACGTNDLQLPLLIFPGNRIVRQKWCHNLKIDNISKWNFSRHLCSKHFEERCFSAADEERILLKDAVPTLHLKHMDVNIFHND